MTLAAVKVRIYPNQAQTRLVEQTMGCCRYVYNHFLEKRKDMYEQTGETLGYAACSALLTRLKHDGDHDWLCEVDATALQAALKILDQAFLNFFRRVKAGVNPAGYPRFRCKNDPRSWSYQTKNNHDTIRILNRKNIRLPKLGKVKCKGLRPLPPGTRILSATVTKSSTGKYYCSLQIETTVTPKPRTGAVVGVDMGVVDTVTTSDGDKYSNGREERKLAGRVARVQRRMSRRTKGSRNYAKARLAKNRLQEKIRNRRRDQLHKITNRLVTDYDVIAIEDLNVKGMMANHHLARSIADTGMSTLTTMLKYKTDWHGKTLVTVDRFFPSSQLCSKCGYRNPKTKDLAIRYWVCPQCHTGHDRDVNAALNILGEGMRLYELDIGRGTPESTLAETA